MTKQTKDTLVLVGVGLFVALPDILPFLGDFIDAGVVAWGMNYFRSQAALLYPGDPRFDNRPHVDQYGGRRYDGHVNYPPARPDDAIDVEWRRS